MRVWLARLALLGLLGVAGFWAWHWLFPSAEQVIRKDLKELAKAASITTNEGALARLANARKLSSFFSHDAQITIDVPGRSLQTLNGQDDIQQAAMGVRAIFNVLKVHFIDVVVTVGADKQSALVDLTATATLPGEQIPEVQELELRFKKLDHNWLITRVVTVRTLR